MRQCLYWLVPVRDDTNVATPSPNSNGPPLTRKATLEIYTVARAMQDLPPGCFTTPPGVFLTAPWSRTPPQGCLQAPPGVISRPLRVQDTPGGCWQHYPGVAPVRTRG